MTSPAGNRAAPGPNSAAEGRSEMSRASGGVGRGGQGLSQVQHHQGSSQQSDCPGGQPLSSHCPQPQTFNAVIHSARSVNSQIRAFRTADSPPMMPITSREINRIHSNVKTPRRLRPLFLVRRIRFMVLPSRNKRAGDRRRQTNVPYW